MLHYLLYVHCARQCFFGCIWMVTKDITCLYSINSGCMFCKTSCQFVLEITCLWRFYFVFLEKACSFVSFVKFCTSSFSPFCFYCVSEIWRLLSTFHPLYSLSCLLQEANVKECDCTQKQFKQRGYMLLLLCWQFSYVQSQMINLEVFLFIIFVNPLILDTFMRFFHSFFAIFSGSNGLSIRSYIWLTFGSMH